MPTKRNSFDEAARDCFEAREAWMCLQTAIGSDIRDRQAVENLLAKAPRGLYQHFKGGLYVVETVVYDVNGIFDPIADYASLYGELAGLSAGRSLYGKDGFLDPVNRPGIWVGRRFICLRLLTVMQAAKLRSNARRIAQAPTHEAKMARIARLLRP